jgi:hypothetical protein
VDEGPLTPYVYSAKSATQGVGVRSAAKLSAPKTGQVIAPGEVFSVVRVVTKEGVPFAVLPGVRREKRHW